MRSSRREFGKLGLAAIVAAVALRRVACSEPRARASPLPSRTTTAPRHVVSIFLSGGIDAIFTTDPKTRADVEPWVDVPYEPRAIVEAGGLRLGPHFAPLAPFARRLAIVNGVQVRTANHNTGREQFLRMKTGTRPEMPSLLALIADARDTRDVPREQPLGCMSWPFALPHLASLFSETDRDDLRRMAEVLRAESKGVAAGGTSAEHRRTAKSLGESGALLERLAVVGPIRYETWSTDDALQTHAKTLQRTLFALEHDLARTCEVNLGGGDQPWDTHTFNTERQTRMARTIPLVARFFAELEKRRGRGRERALVDETLVVMGSEVGRYPATNTAEGKDHFPEVPIVFYGAAIDARARGNGGSFGSTGTKMEAMPVSLATGQRVRTGGHDVILDDVGTTILRASGVRDPSVYGYDGSVLEFLGVTGAGG